VCNFLNWNIISRFAALTNALLLEEKNYFDEVKG
jgi:hypothetical protein